MAVRKVATARKVAEPTVTPLETIGDPSNDAEKIIGASVPYVAVVTLEGVAALLFHRWSVDSVAAKAEAAKGSTAKKTDDLESYVWRTPAGELALPGEYLRMSIVNAAKFRQDPRSPRKSAYDLFKAAVISLSDLASLGTTDWDYLDRRRVMVQRNGVTRVRPAMNAGWRAEVELQVNLPEYVSPTVLHSVLIDAGRLIGVGDFRPTFGRFQVKSFDSDLG